jgi:hypothetical protein
MCTFSVPFQQSPDEIISKLSSTILSNKGSFEGNNSSGTLKVPTPIGSVSASYQVSGQSMNVTITNKPFLLSCSQIESYIKQFLKSG